MPDPVASTTTEENMRVAGPVAGPGRLRIHSAPGGASIRSDVQSPARATTNRQPGPPSPSTFTNECRWPNGVRDHLVADGPGHGRPSARRISATCPDGVVTSTGTRRTVNSG
ncbi:hypothetical protein GCM10025868_43430 [Angustibacter aerolatus]|uniref:Uncharacterized protein n=1 Tax=Angustibacter aerolatus TaxID=1162965 RepID=A0ABQ6JM55_9ACTN|nr:hypothetical protein GCM10025868_43430 [Angustibacter aerolatus]